MANLAAAPSSATGEGNEANATSNSLNHNQLLRYSRHLLLSEFSEIEQQKLLAAHVLVVGVGGLGCPAALYLTTAGVGRLTLADADTVDITNLQRQILYSAATIGHAKVESAQQALAKYNPDVRVMALNQRLDGEALNAAVAAADLVLDCSDNFATRHAVNRAVVSQQKILVSGAAIRFSGQLAVFDARHQEGPCYACLFPEDGRADEPDRCATTGVFAPLTAVIGSLQATEAIKLLSGVGSRQTGKLWLYDALDGDWRSIDIVADPQCPVCGQGRANKGGAWPA